MRVPANMLTGTSDPSVGKVVLFAEQICGRLTGPAPPALLSF